MHKIDAYLSEKFIFACAAFLFHANSGKLLNMQKISDLLGLNSRVKNSIFAK